MEASRFQEFIENVKEAVAIHKGKQYPEKKHVSDQLDVKAIRLRFNFSQSKFALMLGISKRTLENWEQGTRKPTGAARRLLEVAACFPDAVYRAVFERHIEHVQNPDGTVTEVSKPLTMAPTTIAVEATLGASSHSPASYTHVRSTALDNPGQDILGTATAIVDAYNKTRASQQRFLGKSELARHSHVGPSGLYLEGTPHGEKATQR